MQIEIRPSESELFNKRATEIAKLANDPEIEDIDIVIAVEDFVVYTAFMQANATNFRPIANLLERLRNRTREWNLQNRVWIVVKALMERETDQSILDSLHDTCRRCAIFLSNNQRPY